MSGSLKQGYAYVTAYFLCFSVELGLKKAHGITVAFQLLSQEAEKKTSTHQAIMLVINQRMCEMCFERKAYVILLCILALGLMQGFSSKLLIK